MNLHVLKDASEVLRYNDAGIPLLVGVGRMSAFHNMQAISHWHDDFEFVKPIKGHMTYSINGNTVTVQENDALLINSRQIHYSFSDDGNDCEYRCTIFRPALLCANHEIERKYVLPVLDSVNCPTFHLSAGDAAQAEVIGLFDEIHAAYQNNAPGHDICSIGILHTAWARLFPLIRDCLDDGPAASDTDLTIQKQMATFIYQNYAHKISLDDIARAGGVCRSKCCNMFRKYLNKTPKEFLNTYRLEVSTNLLRNTPYSITEIAYACGFNSASYFSELFMRQKGCSPGDYRRNQRTMLSHV